MSLEGNVFSFQLMKTNPTTQPVVISHRIMLSIQCLLNFSPIITYIANVKNNFVCEITIFSAAFACLFRKKRSEMVTVHSYGHKKL